MNKTVAIIGAGRVGGAFARALTKTGWRVTAIASRQRVGAYALAAEIGAAALDAAAAAATADMVLLTVPDGQIQAVAEQLTLRSSQIVLHTSGTQGASQLKRSCASQCSCGCLHPLQSFAGGETLDSFAGVLVAIDGDAPARNMAEKIARSLGANPFPLAEQDRPRYHAAACAASNYLVVLLQWAVRRYMEIGLSEKMAIAALLPLVNGTLDNLQRVGVQEALTGPVSRGDAGTVAAHLAELSGLDRELYRIMGCAALEAANGQGWLNREAYQTVSGLLKNKEEMQ